MKAKKVPGVAARNNNVVRSTKKKATARKAPRVPATAVTWSVRTLDPFRKCGPATTVERLFRVDEKSNGRVTTHLVFLDRRGWYCEHGRACPSVVYARRHRS